MSLWRQRKAIERAVAGQLNPQDDEKLRGHLQGCVECRRYYDALSVQARILAGDPHSTAAASERELARLLAAIDPAKAPVVTRAWWPKVAMAGALAGAVVLGIVVFQLAQVAPAEEVAWRGAEPSKSAGGMWVVTAPQDGGELRRDVFFPSGQTAQVGTSDWVAFTPGGVLESPLFRAVLINEAGEALVLRSGKSVALDPGKWRAFGVGAALEDAVLTAAAREAGVDGKALRLPAAAEGPPRQVSGVIIVRP